LRFGKYFPKIESTHKLYVSFWFQAETQPTADRDVIALLSQDTTIMFTLAIDGATNNFLLQTESQTSGQLTATGAVVPGTWQWIELSVQPGASSDVELKVDGVSVASSTTFDTTDYNSDAKSHFKQIRIGGSLDGNGFWFDDLIIHSDQGSSPTGYLGESRIQTLYPDGNGDTVNSTPLSGDAYTNVDEGPVDGTTTYTDLATAADLDLYTFDDPTYYPDTVHGVVLQTHALGSGTTSREYKGKCKSGTTTSDDTDGNSFVCPARTDYQYSTQQFVFLTDPDTAAEWDGAGLDAMQLGVEVVE
jgi:hypothetical protein